MTQYNFNNMIRNLDEEYIMQELNINENENVNFDAKPEYVVSKMYKDHWGAFVKTDTIFGLWEKSNDSNNVFGICTKCGKYFLINKDIDFGDICPLCAEVELGPSFYWDIWNKNSLISEVEDDSIANLCYEPEINREKQVEFKNNYEKVMSHKNNIPKIISAMEIIKEALLK